MDVTGDKLRIEYVPLGSVVRWDRNPKRHDLPALMNSIQRYGFRDAPIFDATLGALVAGNGRSLAVEAIRNQGDDPPPGIAVDEAGEWYLPVQFGNDAGSVTVAEAFAIDHNNLTLSGSGLQPEALWEPDRYADVLRTLADGIELPETVGADEAAALLGLAAAPAGDTEPQIDRAEELRQKWGVEPGQLWRLGDHRLICGDCTDAAVVERVMGGEVAELLIADPEYDACMDWLKSRCFNAIPHWLIMAGDRQHAEAILEMPDRFNQFLVVFFKQFSWNLNVYIPILQHLCIAHYRANNAKNYKLNGLHSVIECSSKFDRQSEHPHAKHTAIIAPLVKGFSPDQGYVLDVFSGSGTTIIACSNLSRRCRAIEIDPGYVAVSLERWAEHTGQTPERIE